MSTHADGSYLHQFTPESDERENSDSPPVEQPEPIGASAMSAIDIPSANHSDLPTTESAPASSSNNGHSHDDLTTRLNQNTYDMLQAYMRLYSVKDPDET